MKLLLRQRFQKHGAMAREEVFLCAASPRSDEIVIQRPAETRAENRNKAAGPFFSDFRSHFDGDAIDDSRDEAFDGLLLHEIATEIESRCAGSGHPKLVDFIFRRVLESVDQT